MKKVILGLMAVVFVVAGSASFAEAKYAKLKKTVSFDTDCPVDRIKVIKKDGGFYTSMYLVEACGRRLKYKRGGIHYYAADKGPL